MGKEESTSSCLLVERFLLILSTMTKAKTLICEREKEQSLNCLVSGAYGQQQAAAAAVAALNLNPSPPQPPSPSLLVAAAQQAATTAAAGGGQQNNINNHHHQNMVSPHNNPLPQQNMLSPLACGFSGGSSPLVFKASHISQPYSPPPSPTNSASTGNSPVPLASGPEQTADPNWQSFKNSVRERSAAMFNNDLMSDVSFMCGAKGSQQKIPAHKYVLATGSSVFYAMFYGGFSESNGDVEIPDVEPAAFLTLLRYVILTLHFIN